MRVALAQALFVTPDILLLDEPTNHLDFPAVLWLQRYLCKYKNTLLVVSHDRHFLNQVTTDILHLHNKELKYYKGNYATFEKVRKEQLKAQKRLYEASEAKRKHMQEFIDKFRFNAKRASLVQSRIKALARMEKVEAVSMNHQEELCGLLLAQKKVTKKIITADYTLKECSNATVFENSIDSDYGKRLTLLY